MPVSTSATIRGPAAGPRTSTRARPRRPGPTRARRGRPRAGRIVTSSVRTASSSRSGARVAKPWEPSVRARSTGSPAGPTSGISNAVMVRKDRRPRRTWPLHCAHDDGPRPPVDREPGHRGTRDGDRRGRGQVPRQGDPLEVREVRGRRRRPRRGDLDRLLPRRRGHRHLPGAVHRAGDRPRQRPAARGARGGRRPRRRGRPPRRHRRVHDRGEPVAAHPGRSRARGSATPCSWRTTVGPCSPGPARGRARWRATWWRSARRDRPRRTAWCSSRRGSGSSAGS